MKSKDKLDAFIEGSEVDVFEKIEMGRIQVYTIWGDAEGKIKYHKMCMAPGKP